MGDPLAPNVVQLDDNLVNGQTYSFQFLLGNWFSLPSVATLQNDIDAQAPDFIKSYQVTQQSGVGLLTNYYFVQFTYEGDGSDVASDVANSLIAAFAAGSNDTFSFVSATSGTPPKSVVAQQVTDVASEAATTVGQTVGTVASGALGGVTSGLGAWILPLGIIAAVVLLIYAGGVSGARRAVAGA